MHTSDACTPYWRQVDFIWHSTESIFDGIYAVLPHSQWLHHFAQHGMSKVIIQRCENFWSVRNVHLKVVQLIEKINVGKSWKYYRKSWLFWFLLLKYTLGKSPKKTRFFKHIPCNLFLKHFTSLQYVKSCFIQKSCKSSYNQYSLWVIDSKSKFENIVNIFSRIILFVCYKNSLLTKYQVVKI